MAEASRGEYDFKQENREAVESKPSEILVSLKKSLENMPEAQSQSVVDEVIRDCRNEIEKMYNDPDISSVSSDEFVEISGSHELIVKVNEIFKNWYGISVPENELPRVVKAKPGESCAYVKYDRLNKEKNYIRFKEEKQLLDGVALSEEMSHFYRSISRPCNITLKDRFLSWLSGSRIDGEIIINEKKGFVTDKREHNTEEFFGFLGRKLLYNVYPKNNNGEVNIFPSGEPTIENSFYGVPKKDVIEITKKIKTALRDIKDAFKAGIMEYEKYSDLYKKLMGARVDYTVHYRGYEFASKVDINKIKNWEKLYSMPDKEVRKRFFTDKPDYSGLE